MSGFVISRFQNVTFIKNDNNNTKQSKTNRNFYSFLVVTEY